DHFPVLRARDSPLQRHQTAFAVLDGAAVHLGVERETAARVFIRICEYTEPVELCRLDELPKSFEIRIRLARKSDDETGSDRHARNGAPDVFDQLQENVGGRAPLHPLQHWRARVLQRHVDVLHERRMRGDRVEQFLVYPIRIRIQETDPFLMGRFDPGQPRQKFCESVTNSEILSITGRILPDQVDLTHALREKARCLSHDRFESPAAKFAAILRNYAKTARVVASLGNLYI